MSEQRGLPNTKVRDLKNGNHAYDSRARWSVVATGIILTLFILPVLSLDIVRPTVEFDEVAHIDYAIHLSEGTIPTWGTRQTDRTLAIEKCMENSDANLGCVRDVQRSDASSTTYSYQAQQPPLGYLPMAATARYLVSDDGFHYRQILLLRLANLGTLVVLSATLALTLSFFTRSLVTVAAVSGLLIANPWFFGAFTYVTNDSAAITYGAVLIGAYVAWLHFDRVATARHAASLAAAGFLGLGMVAALVKMTSILPVTAIGAAIAMQIAISRRWSRAGRKLIPMVFALVGFLVGHAAFTTFRNSSATATERTVIADLLGPSYKNLSEVLVARLKDFQALVLGIQELGIANPTPVYVTPALVILNLVACAMVLWSLASGGSRFAAWMQMTPQTLIAATLLVSLIVLMAVPLVLYLQGPFESSFVGRYLVPLFPLYALAVIPLLERRGWLRWPLIAGVGVTIAFFAVPTSEIFRNLSL